MAGLEPRKSKDAELSKTERRLNVSFFENLGISDDKQTAFLSTLLRNVFEASAKLDAHLAPHGAALHSAVSRMQVSDNPREAPIHRWIRVVDRLGFFSDSNSHAERIVNVGLSFAYRHLEVDALAQANAMLLSQVQVTAADAEEGARRVEGVIVTSTDGGNGVAVGGAGDGSGGGSGADAAALPPIDGPMERQEGAEEERELPAGGMSFPNPSPSSGLGVTNAVGVPGAASVPMRGSVVAAGTTVGAGAAESAPAVSDQEVPLPPGGMMFSPGGATSMAGGTTGSSGAAAAAAGHKPSGPATLADATPRTEGSLNIGYCEGDADEDEDHVGANKSIPSHVIFDHQPTVVPTAFAVEVVDAVLRGIQDRIDGIAVLRQLLDNSVRVLGRSSERPATKPNGRTWPEGLKGDRMALGLRTDAWWPQWRAPQDLPNSVPPVGTVAYAYNRNRPSVSSRWVISVDMSDINNTINNLSIRSARFFPKGSLTQFETLQRLWGRAPIRLPVVVACMMLFATKEEGYETTLADLAAAGRGTIPKNHHYRLHRATNSTRPGLRLKLFLAVILAVSTTVITLPSNHLTTLPPPPLGPKTCRSSTPRWMWLWPTRTWRSRQKTGPTAYACASQGHELHVHPSRQPPLPRPLPRLILRQLARQLVQMWS